MASENAITSSRTYGELVNIIGNTLEQGRNSAIQAVNASLVQTNWSIGKYIVEYEQRGSDRAVYGDGLLTKLSHDLQLRYGAGYNRSTLQYARKLYLSFPICTTVSCKLSWSHYLELLKCDDEMERSFYIKECEKGRWSVRELRRQMQSMLFHRIALSKDKEGVHNLAEKGIEIQSPQDIVHDPYILEFVGLPSMERLKESDLENALIDKLRDFLLELGKGFAFVKRQYPVLIGGRHLKVDLVFYHRILKCFVLIDLKRGEIQHEDIGQMNLYINYFKAEVNEPDDNPPVGIVLGAKKDELLMEYALQGISNQLFASKYQLYLPDREQLQSKLRQLLGE